MAKIRIKTLPKAAFGGQSGFGLNNVSRLFSSKTPAYQSSDPFSLNKTLKEVPDKHANVEAEKGETALGDFDGDGQLEHMNIGGKRHVDGGTKLNVPVNTFIFSDTRSMKIKEDELLTRFGKTKAATPAEIAKQYDINKYKAILADPYSDNYARQTAERMIADTTGKLQELAIVQEGMKGFPQGIPAVAQSKQVQEAEAKYGGLIERMQKGGGTKGARRVIKPTQPDSPSQYSGNGYYDGLIHNPIIPTQQDSKRARRVMHYEQSPSQYPGNGAFNNQIYADLLAKPSGVDAFGIHPPRVYDPNDMTQAPQNLGSQQLNNKPPTVTDYDRYSDGSSPVTPVDSGTSPELRARYRPSSPGIENETEVPNFVPSANPYNPSAMGTLGTSPMPAYRDMNQSPNDPNFKGDNVPFGYLTPDKRSVMDAYANLFDTHKTMPWSAPFKAITPETTYYDPARELAALQSNRNAQMNAAYMTGNAQQIRALSSASTGADDVGNVFGKYNNLNVGQADKASAQAAEIANNEGQYEGKRKTEDYRGTVIADEQYSAELAQKRGALTAAKNNAWVNRSEAYMDNKNAQHFYKDPTTGKRTLKAGLSVEDAASATKQTTPDDRMAEVASYMKKHNLSEDAVMEMLGYSKTSSFNKNTQTRSKALKAPVN